MPIFTKPIPLSLYIHLPWCIRKCPYCDFNSHALKGDLPEALYINALLQELAMHQAILAERPLTSIFFGGGTPSLFSAHGIAQILAGVFAKTKAVANIEITLEANPGTVEQARFQGYRAAGINRLSLGIQSLHDDKLLTLGRIHDRDHALAAIMAAKKAGFSNFNLDIMYGLPNQSIAEALIDIETALNTGPTHFSWYQLTIEPNTLFYRQTPVLPEDDALWEMQLAGQQLLAQNGFAQYEVSAYALPTQQCQHNLNYWQFGDYLGIGAGAHSKITDIKTQKVMRFAQVKHPKDYLDTDKRQALVRNWLSADDLTFEFMLNALRLTNGIPLTLFAERTGLSLERIMPLLAQAQTQDLLHVSATHLCPTTKGKHFLNDLVAMFLAAMPTKAGI